MLGYNNNTNSLSGVTDLYTDLITSTEIDATIINGTTCGLTTINNTNLNSTNAIITNLNAYTTVTNSLNASTETTGTSNITTGNITTLNNTTGNITNANITNGGITNANITNDNVQNLSVSNYANFQTSVIINGTISQTSTTSNNNLTSTQISDLTVSGDTTLQNTTSSNITSDNITLRAGKSISQSGTTNNTLGTTTISTLTVVDQINLPSNISIPAPSIHSGNLYFNSGSSVVQDLSDTTNYNIMKQTSLTGLQMNGDIEQTSGTTILLDTTIDDLSIGGNITQTALGATCNFQEVEVTQSLSVDGVLYTYDDAYLQSIECTSLTLNYDTSGNVITNDEFKALNNIDTTQTIQNQINTINTSITANSGNITSNSTAITTINNNITTINGEITTINSNISNINTELATITDSNNSLQTNAVLTTGDQTIGGTKAFSSNIILSAGLNVNGTNITNTQIQRLNGVNNNIQSQFTALQNKTTNLSFNSSDNTNTFNDNMVIGGDLSIGGMINTTAGQISNTLLGYLYGLSGNIQNQINNNSTNISTLSSQTSNQSYNSSDNTTTFNDNIVINSNLSIGGNINTTAGQISNTLLGYLYGLSGNIQNQINTISNSAVYLSGSQTISGNKTFTFPVILTSGLKAGSTTISNSILNTLSDINTGTTIQTQLTGLSTTTDTNATKLTGISYDFVDTTTISNNVYVTGNLMNLSPTIYYYLSGITSNVQTQLTTNTDDIATNTDDIATNTTNIATNTANIASLQTSVTGLTAIGTITSYVSTSTFTFAGNTNYTFPNQISLVPGTYLISAFIAYYSTTSQSNVTIISNVANYISGGPGQIVTGCNWLGTTAAIGANIVYQLNLPSTPLVVTSTTSYCVYAFLNLSRTFYVYQWGIQAVRIA